MGESGWAIQRIRKKNQVDSHPLYALTVMTKSREESQRFAIYGLRPTEVLPRASS